MPASPGLALVPPRADWSRQGALETARLWEKLGDHIVGIEHIGSTAVRGCFARDSLDFMIGTDDGSCGQSLRDALASLGYAFAARQPAANACLFIRETTPSAQVYVVQHWGDRWNTALLVRDYLRHFPEQVTAYIEAKQAALRACNSDVDAYVAAKASILEAIVARARSWHQTVDEAAWRQELAQIVAMMRDVSRIPDPQKAASLYAERLRQGLVPSDGWINVSRRDMPAPTYRITRSSRWKTTIDPWKERDKLPRFDSGLLGELIYSNEPAVISNLPARLDPKDPAYEYLEGFEMLVTLPQYDSGEALNMSTMLVKRAATFPMHRIPMMVWQANLWGRSVLNSVLRQQLKTTYDELDRELKIVGQIQQSLLPSELPKIPHAQAAVHYRTSQRAGGDYYDFFPLSRDRWGFFIADVSGHGTPAAVMMAVTHAIAHSQPGDLTPPSRVLAFLNEKLTTLYTRGEGTFVTAFYGIYDTHRRRLTYALAGHPGPRLARNGDVLALEGEPGLPLGLEPDEQYPETTIDLAAGDQLVLFTDGIIEAFDPAGAQFGLKQLDDICRQHAATADDLLKRILDAVERFSAGGAPTDDQTLVVVQFDASPGSTLPST